jgi:O-antigen ligase
VLQFWIELGALGLAAASVAFCFVVGRLRNRRGAPLASRLGLLAAVMGVGLVGLSAWQPWWIASVAAALLWFGREEPQP